MRKELIPLLAIAIASALVPLLLTKSAGRMEPTYQGRNITRWLEPLEDFTPDPSRNGSISEDNRRKARQALSAIGTNAIPYLLDLFNRRPSKVKEGLNRVLAKQSLIAFRFAREPDYPQLARKGFYELGKPGQIAMPGLIQLLAQNDEREVANVSQTLWRMLPDSAAPLIAALTNENTSIRANAAYTLCRHTGARIAIPALKRALRDKEPSVRLAAAEALYSLWVPDSEELVIPVFCRSLCEPDSRARLRAVTALERAANHAKRAIPNLIERLNDKYAEVRIAAASALLSIDEATAHNVGVWYWDRDPSLQNAKNSRP